MPVPERAFHRGYWSLGLADRIPARNNVDTVGEYQPSNFGFNGYRKGVRPADSTFEQPT